MNYDYFMQEALSLAKLSLNENEVPVGAVIVKDGKIVGKGRNRREQLKNALSHAEIEAINDACKNLSSWRLESCDLYVTLEPCPMCAGAIINARINKVIYGAKDSKMGAVSSIISMFDLDFNHRPKVVFGVMENECSEILSDFFKSLR
ncbi:MAG: nucleoside deaminase [Acutalibacteraceae bacterium]|nr:nucleoside deaminase [Acutalibacteraceae bacterium]